MDKPQYVIDVEHALLALELDLESDQEDLVQARKDLLDALTEWDSDLEAMAR